MQRLRPSKTSLVILVPGIFMVLIISLGFAYDGQRQQRNDLAQELYQAKLRLASYSGDGLSRELEGLEQEAPQLEAEIDAAQNRLSQPLDDVRVTRVLFALARACNVDLLEVHLQKPEFNDAAAVPLLTLTMTMNVTGDLPSTVNFISRLASRFPTSRVETARITMGEAPQPPLTSITMVIHDYAGK